MRGGAYVQNEIFLVLFHRAAPFALARRFASTSTRPRASCHAGDGRSILALVITTTTLAKKTGRGIAERRKLLGLTQEELAERVDVTFEAISRIERGVSLPTLLRLEVIARALGINVIDLLRTTERRTSTRQQRAVARVEALLRGRGAREVELIADVAARILRG